MNSKDREIVLKSGMASSHGEFLEKRMNDELMVEVTRFDKALILRPRERDS